MNGKDRAEVSKNSKKAAYKHVVSEGSVVVLDAHDIIGDVDTSSIKNYSWNQTSGMHIIIDDTAKDKWILSFTAPLLEGDDINTTLNFEFTDKGGNTRNYNCNASVIVKRVQRAIIFQGGVALGAYEAGVYGAIVEKLIKNNKDRQIKGSKKRPLFDIVAGTSIGAMNGAIVVSSVTADGKSVEDEKNWQASTNDVIDFWTVQKQWPTIADYLDMIPFYHYWCDTMHYTSTVFKQSANDLIEQYLNANPAIKSYTDMLAGWFLMEPGSWKDIFIDGWYIPSTAEARRRYYSAMQFLRTVGSFNVATGIYNPLAFGKFFDYLHLSNLFPARADNKHFVLFSLKRTLQQFAQFPINTSPPDHSQFPRKPRLLLVTVDVKTGDAITFDSYSKHAKYRGKREIIHNRKGIGIDHALATGTFPDFFDYPKFIVEMGEKKQEHIFWDGGFRSNTPLREVLQAHRDYWLDRARDQEQQRTKDRHGIEQEDGEYDRYENVVPDLEVYIADLWPSELKKEPLSFDRDFVQNREWNLILGDKTDYDEQVASVVTDYVDLTRRLKDLAERAPGGKKEINHILNSQATSISTIGKRRIYKELLEGRFRLVKVVHIDRRDDGNEVADNIIDYSYKTIEELIDVGYYDASVQMDLQQLKEGVMELSKRNGRYFEKEQDNGQVHELIESLCQIETLIKIQDGRLNSDTIVEQIKKFKDKVEHMGETPVEERMYVVAAADQLQNTITTVAEKMANG
jgi:NTE family protein